MEKPKFVYVTHVNTTPEKLWAALTRAFKKILWPRGARIFGFERAVPIIGFGEGACPLRPVTEPKRSANPKRPHFHFSRSFLPAWLQYFFNRSKPEFTRQYWNYDIESDWKPGSSVELIRAGEKPKLNGVVLRYEPPHVLSYTFVPGCKQTELPPEKSSVTFEITVEFDVTKLTVTHEFQSDTRYLGETSQGWQCIISSLKSLLETGHALPFVWKS